MLLRVVLSSPFMTVRKPYPCCLSCVPYSPVWCTKCYPIKVLYARTAFLVPNAIRRHFGTPAGLYVYQTALTVMHR